MIAVVPLMRGLWWIYLWAFLLEVGSIVFLPARDASIPISSATRRLRSANSLVLGSSYGCDAARCRCVRRSSRRSRRRLLRSAARYALVFWIDAAHLRDLVAHDPAAPPQLASHHASDPAAGPDPTEEAGEPTAFPCRVRIAARARRARPGRRIAVELGARLLFSLGIVFVARRSAPRTWSSPCSSPLFGVGAGVGLLLLQRATVADLTAAHVAVATQGVTIVIMSLAPSVFVVPSARSCCVSRRGRARAGMSAVQRELDGHERVVAFTAFHVVIRVGLSFAVIGAGVAADLLGRVGGRCSAHSSRPAWCCSVGARSSSSAWPVRRLQRATRRSTPRRRSVFLRRPMNGPSPGAARNGN